MSVNFCAIGGDGTYLLEHALEEKLRYLGAGLATESAGVWHGGVAKHFGIAGHRIDPVVFKNLIRGFSPDGKRGLTQNAGAPDRALGWEGVVAPHKSVSDLLAVLPLSRWHEVLSCHNDAVAGVIRSIEDLCGVTRRGKGGHKQERAGLLLGEHLHLTNRENEPQVHTHLSILNVSVRTDGTFGAIVSKLFYTHQRLLNAVYQQSIARLLRERLGIVCEVDGYAARVAGVPDAFLEATSTRSAQIEKLAGPQKSRSPRSAHVAALTSRKAKVLQPVSVLARQWASLARTFGFTFEQVVRQKPKRLTPKAQEKLIGKAIRAAARGLVLESPVFDRLQLAARTLTNLIGTCISHQEAMATIDLACSRPQPFGLVDLGEHKKQRGYTTAEHLKREERLVRELDALAQARRPLVRPERVEKVLANYPSLKDEQKQAVRVLADGGRLSVLTGYAGTGKTTALKALKEILSAGLLQRRTLKPQKVLGVAVSGRAADTLQAETGIPSMTLAKFLKDSRPTPLVEVFLAVRKIQFPALDHLVKYARAVRRPKVALDRRTTVVLDEASLAATKDLLELARRVNRAGARLVLVGDPAQLQAIGPGGGLDLVIHRFPERVRALLDVRRQEADWERQAVKDIARGEAAAAILAYKLQGRLTVSKDLPSAREAAVKLYSDSGGLTAPREHLLLANTNQDVRWLNHLAQHQRLTHGLLDGRPLRVEGPSPGLANDFYAGDRVLFGKNAHLGAPSQEQLPERLLRLAVDPLRRKLAEGLPDWARVLVEPRESVGVRNGQFGTVLAVLPQLSRMLLELDTGARVVVNAAKYQHLSLGYATSVFKSQSSTVEHVYALLGDRMTDRESAYVAASRGRRSTHLVVDGSLRSPGPAAVRKPEGEQTVKELIRQVAQSHKQVAALEHKRLADARKPEQEPARQQELEQELYR